MARRHMALCLAITGLFTVGGACSERTMRERWDDTFNHSSRATRDRALDLNSASRQQLAALPGLTDQDAQRIVDHRPYDRKRDLLQKKVLGQGKYSKIEDYVFVARDR